MGILEYQVELKYRLLNGNNIVIHPITTDSDVFIRNISKTGSLKLPGEGGDRETLNDTLANIRKYLDNLSNIAQNKMKVSSDEESNETDTLATTSVVYAVKHTLDETKEVIEDVRIGNGVEKAKQIYVYSDAGRIDGIKKIPFIENLDTHNDVKASKAFSINYKSSKVMAGSQTKIKGNVILNIGDADDHNGLIRMYGGSGTTGYTTLSPIVYNDGKNYAITFPADDGTIALREQLENGDIIPDKIACSDMETGTLSSNIAMISDNKIFKMDSLFLKLENDESVGKTGLFLSIGNEIPEGSGGSTHSYYGGIKLFSNGVSDTTLQVEDKSGVELSQAGHYTAYLQQKTGILAYTEDIQTAFNTNDILNNLERLKFYKGFPDSTIKNVIDNSKDWEHYTLFRGMYNSPMAADANTIWGFSDLEHLLGFSFTGRTFRATKNAAGDFEWTQIGLSKAEIENIYFPKTGGVVSGNIVLPNTDTMIYGEHISGTKHNHALFIGHGGQDYWNFYEYGGVFNFYKSRDNVDTLLGKITENGWEGKIKIPQVSIFGKAFTGDNNVEGQTLVYGTYNASPSNRFWSSGIQIRENDLVGSTQTDIGYAPTIGFHWGNRRAATLLFDADDGYFKFRNQDGTTRAVVDANVNGAITHLQSHQSSGALYSRGEYLIRSIFNPTDARFYLKCQNNNSDGTTYQTATDFATYAHQDSSGKVIANSYLPLSGGTMTGAICIAAGGAGSGIRGGGYDTWGLTNYNNLDLYSWNGISFSTSITGSPYACAGKPAVSIDTRQGNMQVYNTITAGNILLRKGRANYGSKLNFGDADYVYLHEDVDDHLKIYAKNGVDITAVTGGTVSFKPNSILLGDAQKRIYSQSSDANTNHCLKMGYNQSDYWDFYEYGGVFNFYKSQSNSNTLLGKITTNGWEGKILSNIGTIGEIYGLDGSNTASGYINSLGLGAGNTTVWLNGLYISRYYGNMVSIRTRYSNDNNFQGITMGSNSKTHSNPGFLHPIQDNKVILGGPSERWQAVYAATGTIQTSDRNYKKEEKELDEKMVIDLVTRLPAKSFKYKENESNRTHYGFIAQDLEDLLLELDISSQDMAAFVKTPNDRIKETNNNGVVNVEREIIPEGEEGYGFRYALRYQELIAPLWKFAQILYEKNKAQEIRIALLEKKIASMTI